VKAAQRANQKLARGEMAGTDNPFVSHRSGAMDKVQLKNQEWAVNHEYVTDTGGGMADTEAADEAAYLASLSKKVSFSKGRILFHQYCACNMFLSLHAFRYEFLRAFQQDRKLLAKYTQKLSGATTGGAIGKERKKHKKEKHKKEKHKKEKHKKKRKKHKTRGSSDSSSS
jgi:hypothetical protein